MEKFCRGWSKFSNAVFAVVRYVCVLLLATLVAVVFWIFLGRYVFHNSPFWGEPLSLLCLVWMSILGSALCIRTDEHLKVTIFDERMSKRALLATDILATVCIFAFAVFLIVYGWRLTLKATGNNMAALNIPYSCMYVSMPIAGVLYIIALVDVWIGRVCKK